MTENKVLVNNKKDAEFFLNILIIGILTAFHNGKITLDDAWHLLFRPGVIDCLESKLISKSIINILWLCTELEDVESLIPDKLGEETIKLINQLLANLDDFDGLSDHVLWSIDITGNLKDK